ncbi:helix-turn-helix domain-containing protein [Arenimonas composti]|uniref:HTH cro/C1-type domain-containing protein n=1 Tax=Arenimonas composti TR7-09 = DSM 18010 TaxID=1121013 RepID=A0A091B9R1_9GAMM|nr:helix-turn-helix transcriptional regulator [Arenimonas composti]KFN48242.1 hypothetical protein P873_01410 [Arenimonas composti TR7-09 = DSM 18010]
MANIAVVLKSEIARLARREIKTAVEPLRKANAQYRREIAALKRDVEALRRELRGVAKASRRAAPPAGDEGEAPRTRFVAKGLRSLRARLGLSAADFGRLAGVSGQSIYQWETGKTVPRAAQQAKLAELRGIGKREAARRLEASA